MSEEVDAIDCWCPKPSPGLQSRENAFGLPTVVPRTPVNLMRECEMAYDDGLILAALTLVVTVPDVCSRIDGTDYRTWAAEYLHLENDGKRMDDERNDLKSEADVERGFDEILSNGIFTASDLYQLRCAVVHAGSSSIDGKGSAYSPYRVIGVSAGFGADKLVAQFGHTANGMEQLENCSYDCVVSLEGLISRMAKGVARFVKECPERNREYSSKKGFDRIGVTDFRPLRTREHIY